jgi:hypothetical protein
MVLFGIHCRDFVSGKRCDVFDHLFLVTLGPLNAVFLLVLSTGKPNVRSGQG